MEIIDLANISPSELAELARQVEPLRTLGDLLDWARQLTPSVRSPEVVTQDEYAHDVLVPHPSGRWLDFDTT